MNTKLVSIILVIVMLLSLCACKNKQEEAKNTTEEVKTEVTAPAETTVATEPTETLADIDRDDVVRETEPAVNKGTIITGEDKNQEETADEEDAAQDEDNATTPVETVPAEEVGISIEEKTEYEKLLEMSGEEQQAFMESFESLEAFFAWLEEAKAEYEAKNPGIEIGTDGIVAIG